MTARLEVSKLRVRSGARLIVDVESLELAQGELAVALGEASSGKSTLAAALGGLMEASGIVRVDGSVVSGSPSRRRRAGLAVAVRDGRRIAGVTVDEALRLAGAHDARRHEVLERFPELVSRRHVEAQLLSGGEQQLLQVACAWTARARVLVLDSPAVGLAARAAAAVAAIAREEAERGSAVLWLESDVRAAPAAPGYTLVRGQVVRAAESASLPD